jgi:UDP-N-acetylmuramoyl-L-alanyl-D-glutamate--2,6-diaminopimelate ligase
MTLSNVLEGVSIAKMFHITSGKMLQTRDVEVSNIQYDSRKVQNGDLFVAIRGSVADGHVFIGDAVNLGARVVVLEDDAAMPDSFFMHEGVAKIVVSNSRRALATMSANFYGHPSKQLQLIGVTGTNGKTTTTYLIKSILEAANRHVGLIGTVEYRIAHEIVSATHTTPESLELNQLLATMVKRGCTAAVMEVSSHSLAMSRVYGLTFAAAVFSNLTQDHLDFHGSMEEYFKAKKLLFDCLSEEAYAVTNADDSYGLRIIDSTRAIKITYGTKADAEVRAVDCQSTLNRTTFTVVRGYNTQSLSSSLTGGFNVTNILAAYTTGIGLGIDEQQIRTGIKNLKSVPGRFEQIGSPGGWAAIVDYAHTPDALESCLRTVREILPSKRDSKIITVFGCGGKRDRTKRPMMGRIATELSDIAIVTSDNPRSEDPQSIIDEVLAGAVKGKTVYAEVDRREAILRGLNFAKKGDIVLIAGKGHEKYQVVGETQIPFDDREEVSRFILKQS